MKRLGVVLLAAGESRRMGSPKQLISVDGTPLVRHVSNLLLALKPDVFCVVLGAEATAVRAALDTLPVEFVENLDWREGLGSSIACGVRHIERRTLDGLLIALCDQPTIPTSHFEQLAQAFGQGQHDIVVTDYAGSFGVPAIFSRAMFASLGALKGDRGAKSLMQNATRKIAHVPCEAAAIDLDTMADVHRFQNRDA